VSAELPAAESHLDAAPKSCGHMRAAYRAVRGAFAYVSDSDENVVRRCLSRIPVIKTAYRHTNYIVSILYEGRWLNPQTEFDNLHRLRVWNFDSPVEQERHHRTVAALRRFRGNAGWGDVLELGCSEGAFTERIAPLCHSLLACDTSAIACARTRQRCAGKHVRVEQIDIAKDGVSGSFDVAFVLDVLDCIHGSGRVKAVWSKVIQALKPGGVVVVSGCRLPIDLRSTLWSRLLLEGGDNHISFLQQHPALRFLSCEPYPDPTNDRPVRGYLDHLIAVFERRSGS
jgi:SAM-dependent methyltransferase